MNLEMKIRGRVKFFDAQKGFGFITPNDGSSDIFVHQSSIRVPGFRSLTEGQEVDFDVEQDKVNGKTFASNVALATQGKKRMIRGRHEVIPRDLYRFTTSNKKIKLRDSQTQATQGLLTGYDIKVHEDYLVYPAPLDNIFIGPNGASLRSVGVNMYDLITERDSDCNILELQKGLVIPEGLVLLHESFDHFSLQCSMPMRLDELENRINTFFQSCTLLSADEFMQKNPLENLMDTFMDD